MTVATTTAFLYAGALQELINIRKDLDLEAWGGHAEFVSTCADFAKAIEAWLETREADNRPGVLQYEIIEPLGVWLINRELPLYSTEEVLHEFQKRYLEWIKGTDSHGIKPTDRAMAALRAHHNSCGGFDAKTTVTALLVDLHHYADTMGLPFYELCALSDGIYTKEAFPSAWKPPLKA